MARRNLCSIIQAALYFFSPGPVAIPKHWPRSSAWSPTTWRETIPAKECVCPGRWSRRSPKSGAHIRHTPTNPLLAMLSPTRSGDNENHSATATAPGTPGTPLPLRTSPPTPSNYADILRPTPPHTSYWGYLSQGDTHLDGFIAGLGAVHAEYGSRGNCKPWLRCLLL